MCDQIFTSTGDIPIIDTTKERMIPDGFGHFPFQQFLLPTFLICIWMGNLFCESRFDDSDSRRTLDLPVSTTASIAIHSDVIFDVCSSEVSSEVFSCSADHSIVRYDYVHAVVKEKWTHMHSVQKILYTPKKRLLFSGSRDKTVRLWKTGWKDPVRTFDGHSLVIMGIACNQGEDVLCSGSRDYSVRWWDIETGVQKAANSITLNMVTALKWIEANDVLQTSEDLIMKVWDARTAAVSQNFPKTDYFPLDCDVTADGNAILTAMNGFDSHGCMVQLWDRRMLKLVYDFEGHEHACNSACFFQSDGLKAISVSKDGCVRVWDILSHQCMSATALTFGALTSIRPLNVTKKKMFVIGCTKEMVIIIEVKYDGEVKIVANTIES